ncbi:MAG: DUF1566 domain-containing protein [Leptospirales bacterium]|nr:DUF1566 domain-containing protein [Leptospirales bacterium]
MRKFIKFSVFLLVAFSSLLIGCSKNYEVGDRGPGGGIIFYVSKAGFTVEGYGTAHYLEAAPADMGRFKWSRRGTSIGGTGTGIGRGRNNTDRILAKVPDAPAAKACKDYRGGGKTDWFLPSEDELKELYRQRNLVLGFENDYYWYSSSSGNPHDQQSLSFSEGNRYGYDKDTTLRVRAVRAF